MDELKISDTLVGTGKDVVKGALIICNYTGLLEDGTKFDSSNDHGRPFQLRRCSGFGANKTSYFCSKKGDGKYSACFVGG